MADEWNKVTMVARTHGEIIQSSLVGATDHD